MIERGNYVDGSKPNTIRLAFFSNSHKWNSRPSNCLSSMNTTARLPGNSYQFPIKLYSRPFPCVLLIIILLPLLLLPGTDALITSVNPSIIPIQGQVTLYITGTGFELVDFPKCQILTPNSILAIDDNTVINDSVMKCTVPATTSIQRQSFNENANKANLTVIPGINGSLKLSFFNQDAITVTGMKPDWTYTSSYAHVNVTMYGNGFIQTNQISCYSSLFETKAIFVNATELMCQFPPQIVTMKINIAVYSVGQLTSIIQGSDLLEFTYFATPPKVLFFKFNPSYTSLILQFDQEIELGNETEFNITKDPDCKIIFNSIDVFGVPEPSCYWQNTQQRQIILQLNSHNSTVQPNTSVPLNNDIIRTRYVTYSKLTTGAVIVSENDNPLYPVAIIEGPQSIPHCGEYILNGYKSYNGGPKPLHYSWNITIVMDNDDSMSTASGDEGINDYANELSNIVPYELVNQPSIAVMAEKFDTGVDYRVMLTVTNFLDRVDQAQMIVTKRQLPALNVWILGSDHRVVDSTTPLLIEGMISIPTCVVTSSMISYSWLLLREDGSVIELDEIVTSNQYLQLQPNTLELNTTYTLSFHASTGNNAAVSSANFTIHTIPVNFKAIIFGGTVVVRGVDDVLVLDSTHSIGLIGDNELVRVHWSCLSEAHNTACTDNNNPVLDSDGIDDSVTVIPADILPPSSYVITLQLLYSNNVVSTSQQVIRILNNTNGPRVFIEEPMNVDRINVHRRLVINGLVESMESGEVTWSSVYKPGYAFLTLNEHSVTDTPLTVAITAINDDQLTLTQTSETNNKLYPSSITPSPYVNSVSLSIRPDLMLPDNKYCFRLTVTTDVSGNEIKERYAEIEVHTAPQPSFGDVTITPLTGLALDTVFRIRGVYWSASEGDYPLYYRFGFKVKEDVKWLTMRTQDDSLLTILPYIGHNDLTFVLEVTDSHNTTTTVTKVITVAMDTIDLGDIDAQIRAKVSKVVKLNQYFSYLSSVLFTVDTLPSSSHGEVSVNAFKTSMCQFLLDLYEADVFPPNIESHQLLVTVLNSLVSDMNPLSDSYLSQLLWLLEGIAVEDYNELFVQEGIADYLIAIFGNLLSMNSQFDTYYSRIANDEITKSFVTTSKSIGRSICHSTGVFSPSQHINNNVIGSIKVYHGLLLPAYNLSCGPTSNDSNCPFTNTYSSSVSISGNVLQEMIKSSCGEYGYGTKPCSSYCFITWQLLNDIHWSGSPYASVVKSYPVSYHLVSTETNDEIEDASLTGVIEYNVFLRQAPSNNGKGQLKCVYWDDGAENWVEDGCSIKETGGSVVNGSSTVIQCSCQVLKEVVVIDECQPGYFGENCDKVCPYGLYGMECSEHCDCSPMGRCSPFNGSCDCSPGWIGAKCDTICPTGAWGKYCAETCQCENGASCDPIDGGCGCTPGWIGEYCNIECPDGFYGDSCSYNCTCRSNVECDFITGNCSCESGYIGLTCHTPCPDNYYGENCTSECSCIANGTDYCDNVNGTCYCKEMWGGDYCETPPYSPVLIPVDPLPIWIIIVPPIAGLTCAVIVFIVIILIYISWKKRKRKKSAVHPVEGIDGESGSESKKSSMIDGEFELTRAKSRTLVIPDGKTLKDIFRNGTDNGLEEFKEPEIIGAKKRWQIIQVLLPTELSKKPSPELKTKPSTDLLDKEKMKVESGIEIESIDGEESPIDPITGSMESASYDEIIYRKGIYLDSDATLKDLRNGFIDSSQLDPDDIYFKFLNSDIPGDYISIDDEEEMILAKLEPNLIFPRSLFIELVDKNSVSLELCVCGKFAELECIECRAKGYCSEPCQSNDWMPHSSMCRIVSARRRKAKKMKKKRKKLEKMMRRNSTSSRGGFSPNPDRCICDKEAQYECSECGKQGYCSERCQQDDWELHQLFCEGGKQQQNNDNKLNVIVEDEGLEVDETMC